uniref:Uncharacterized protein n=1 Tax=viral metagenome TaxID=1070528 RepID=A0A6M3KUR7_9ZZZZ
MKVTFCCEKCGRELQVYYSEYYDTGVRFCTPKPCPKCNPPEPAYGPITVEIAEKFLKEAALCGEFGAFTPTGRKYLKKQARAVVRLMKYISNQAMEESLNKSYDWLDKLLRLARED